MTVVNDPTATLAWSAVAFPPKGLKLALTVKRGFLLKNDSVALSSPEAVECSGDVFSDCEDQNYRTLIYPSDFSPFKPRADILFLGTAHVPAGKSVPHMDVALRVGGFKKSLWVVGDRSWERRFLLWRKPSVPAEFNSLPITYQRAFGGGKFKRNPAGLGHHGKRLANLESGAFPIQERRNRTSPASFGPISPDWEPRRSKVGTYKGKWLKERWPWFPDDFDWSYFNAAPEDQQVDGYLRGDEELEFQNLHSQYPIYRSRLPGLRTRAFIQIELPDTEPEFREVKMNLDTLWIDMDAEKLVLVWRGLTPVRSLKFKEVTHLAVLTEPLALPVRPKEEMREWMHQQIREERGEGPPSPEEAAEDVAAKASQEAFDKEMAAMDNEEAELEKEFAGLEEEVGKQLEQEKARLIAEGVDPKILEQPPKPQTVAEMKAQFASEVASLSETDPQAAAKLAGFEKELDELGTMDQEFAALDAEETPRPTRESVQANIAQGKPVNGADLCGHDLSNLDLSGADLSDTDFSGANLSGTKLVGACLIGVNFTEANLAGADFTQAVLDGADFSEAKLEGAKFPGTSIAGASFSEQQLQGADFSDCKGRYPNFSSSNLAGANFARAKLPLADFGGATVKAANFVEAELVSADFGGAAAMGVNMEKADLTNLRAAEKSNFTGGKFREAKAPTSIWEGAILDQADFSRAVLTGALFEEASLKETRFDRAELTKAAFDDAQAQKAILTNANLLRASFNRTNLTEANLAGSNLYEASFWETVFHHTNIDGANIKRTSIA